VEITTEELKSNHISVFLLGDVHEGNGNHNELAFKQCVKKIKDTAESGRFVRVIGMGDYIDAINIKDPRFSPSEIHEKYGIRELKDLPRKQMKEFYAAMKPIKEYFKQALVGNHEESYIKHGGFDVYDYLCSDLMGGTTKLGYQGMVQYTCGEHDRNRKNIIFSLTHGCGGGGFREGYATNNLFDVFRKFRSDFYVMGHVHKIESRHMDYSTISRVGKYQADREWYGVSGCFLDTFRVGHRNYFEGNKGELSHIGMLEARIDCENDIWKKDLVKIIV
jgi:hypothetical protein